jgi:molybdopterin-synthase adenylyltransferase
MEGNEFMAIEENIFERIEKLFDIGILRESKILIAGCGSGGSNVALQLAMAGIVNFTLLDKDILGYENVIRHACGIRFIGKRKIDALEEVLLDRNPNINITKIHADIMHFSNFESLIADSSVVVLATDNDPSRYYVNELCVKNGINYVTARVFTRGIGGEVFSYQPPNGACLACLESLLERTKFRSGIKEIDLISEKEREKIYGMEIPEIKDSPGLNVDISFISNFHVRFTLESIFSRLQLRPKNIPPIEDNYLIWGNRPVHPFSRNFQIQQMKIHRQEGCLVCSK